MIGGLRIGRVGCKGQSALAKSAAVIINRLGRATAIGVNGDLDLYTADITKMPDNELIGIYEPNRKRTMLAGWIEADISEFCSQCRL